MAGDAEHGPPGALPFPASLCHRCDAPPRYIRTSTSIFIYCPRMPRKYPPQPVAACAGFRPKAEAPNAEVSP